jgi:hypothetical protein
VWLALLTTSGSLARVVGPLFVTDLYQEYGTYVTFGVVTGTYEPTVKQVQCLDSVYYRSTYSTDSVKVP